MTEKWEVKGFGAVRGKRTHGHAIVGLIIVVVGYLKGQLGLFDALIFASILCALGTIRWTLTGVTNVLDELRRK